jgi:hypothetical protein
VTLVLGAIVGHGVVLCADRKVLTGIQGGQLQPEEGEKLVERWGYGIALFGCGPPGPPTVPDRIRALEATPGDPFDAAEAIISHFGRYQPPLQMGAFVGGIDASGPLLLRLDVETRACRRLVALAGRAPGIWSAGTREPPPGLDDPSGLGDVSSACERMLAVQRATSVTDPFVGVAFDVLALRPGQPPAWLASRVS